MRMAGSPAVSDCRDETRAYCWEIFPKIQSSIIGQKSPISPVASGGQAGTMWETSWEGVAVMLRNEALVALEVRALSRASWLRREMLEALAEVNHRCLGLLAEQALLPGAPVLGGQGLGTQSLGTQPQPALRQVGELWRALDERSRWQAAACPYLLVDACFGDPQRWQWLSGSRLGEAPCAPYASFFTVPQTAAV